MKCSDVRVLKSRTAIVCHHTHTHTFLQRRFYGKTNKDTRCHGQDLWANICAFIRPHQLQIIKVMFIDFPEMNCVLWMCVYMKESWNFYKIFKWATINCGSGLDDSFLCCCCCSFDPIEWRTKWKWNDNVGKKCARKLNKTHKNVVFFCLRNIPQENGKWFSA